MFSLGGGLAVGERNLKVNEYKIGNILTNFILGNDLY